MTNKEEKNMEDIKINNINLKQRLHETEANLSLTQTENTNLSKQIELLETKLQDDSLIVKKSIEMFENDNFIGEKDEDIKMYILGMNWWPLKSVLEENIWCPDCNDEFEHIGKLKKTLQEISVYLLFLWKVFET